MYAALSDETDSFDEIWREREKDEVELDRAENFLLPGKCAHTVDASLQVRGGDAGYRRASQVQKLDQVRKQIWPLSNLLSLSLLTITTIEDDNNNRGLSC